MTAEEIDHIINDGSAQAMAWYSLVTGKYPANSPAMTAPIPWTGPINQPDYIPWTGPINQPGPIASIAGNMSGVLVLGAIVVAVVLLLK